MSGINTGKVITGGLLAGLVYNVLDFVNNSYIMGAEFAANSTRLGLDPALQTSSTLIATWVIIDFVVGIVVVFNYAAMRPRFGPGPKTAIYAGIVPWLVVSCIMYGLSQGGLFSTSIWVKMTVIQLITTSIGAVVGAWAYKES